MTESHLLTNTQPDKRLVAMLWRVINKLIIPLLTTLDFVATTVFVHILVPLEKGTPLVDSYIHRMLPTVLVCCALLGYGLGFPLRRALVRIQDTGQCGAGIQGVVGVGFAWILAFLVQFGLLTLIDALSVF